MSAGRQDLDEILHTLREVEASLGRRVARAEGANLMVWSLVGASIFTFYQLVEWNQAPYEAALGPLLPWVWLGPIAAGYVASAILGTRLGRVTRGKDARHNVWRGLLSGVMATVLALVLVLTERYHLIYGGVTLVCGVTTLAFTTGSPPSRVRTAAYASGAGMALVGGALLAWPADWAPLVAAAAFVVGLGGLGTLRYRLAE